MKRASGIASFLLFSLPFVAIAQSGAKVGVMNVLRAIVECGEGKQANEEFQKKYEAKREELTKMQKELESLQQQLRSQTPSLTDQSRADLAKNVDSKNTELQRAQQDAEKEFNDLRNEIFNRIGFKLSPLMQQYAKENSYTLILDSSSQNSQLSYIDPAIDITDEIIKLYDRTHPVAGSPNVGTPVSGTGSSREVQPAASASKPISPAKAPAAAPKK